MDLRRGIEIGKERAALCAGGATRWVDRHPVHA
jgi:hypothetical protein